MDCECRDIIQGTEGSECVCSARMELKPADPAADSARPESGASKSRRTSTSLSPLKSDKSQPEHCHRRHQRVSQLVKSFATAQRPHRSPRPGSTASSARMVCVPGQQPMPKQSLTSWPLLSAQRTSRAQERRAEAQGRQVWTRSSYHQPQSQGGERSSRPDSCESAQSPPR